MATMDPTEGGGGGCGTLALSVKRATAVMGVRPAIVFCLLQLVCPEVQVVMSQSQSCEWPVMSTSSVQVEVPVAAVMTRLLAVS